MNQIIDLFKGDNCTAASVLAVVAFVLGLAVMFAVTRLCCPCGKKKGSCAPKNGAQKAAARKPREERPFEKRNPHPAPADGSTEIYAGNLSYDLTEDQLRKEFEAYGKVSLVRIVTNKANDKSRGYGFVQMPSRDEADKAVAALNDKEIMGRKIRCNVAKNQA